MALVNFVDRASDVVTKVTSGANRGLFVLGPAPGRLPNDSFGDVARTKSRQVNNAVSAAYELGIATGTSLDVFAPDGAASRAQMAQFITRALAHTNLRPAGLTAQRTGATITVSVRGDNFETLAGKRIDAFKAPTAQAAEAFNEDGTCNNSRVSPVGAGVECRIDGADPVTGSDGNVTLTAIRDVGDGQTVWIWVGDLGDQFSDDYTSRVIFEVPKGAESPIAAGAGDAAVRIVARKLADGRIEFALQQHTDGDWGDRLRPRVRFFPTTATTGQWLASSALTTPAGQVRIVARKLADGRIEFALQRHADGDWGDRLRPRVRFFPTTATTGQWLASSMLTLTAP